MHELNGLIASPASLSQACRNSARGWVRDPALWAWGVVGLLALLPLRSMLAQLAT